jgi:hypothetical protein
MHGVPLIQQIVLTHPCHSFSASLCHFKLHESVQKVMEMDPVSYSVRYETGTHVSKVTLYTSPVEPSETCPISGTLFHLEEGFNVHKLVIIRWSP